MRRKATVFRASVLSDRNKACQEPEIVESFNSDHTTLVLSLFANKVAEKVVAKNGGKLSSIILQSVVYLIFSRYRNIVIIRR